MAFTVNFKNEYEPRTVNAIVISNGMLKIGKYYVPLDNILYVKED